VTVDRRTVDWRGYWPAAPTPFTALGAVDEAALRGVLRRYREQGVHGVLVNGTTGEWFSQTTAERRLVAELAVDELAGAMPVVVGCTAYTPAEVVALADHARSVGADGALATPPPYAHLTTEEIYHFYATVTTAVELPWMVYNWPRGVSVDIDTETAGRLADLPNVVAFKDSTGDELRAMVTAEAVVERVRTFGRFIHRRGMAFMLGVGGDGNIDGGGIGAPFAVPYYEAVWRGDLDQALAFSARYGAVSASLVNPDYSARFAHPTAQLKAAMTLLGQPGGRVRPPLLDLIDPARLEALAAALDSAGLGIAARTP
jgi:4-hydroxy-tetrahydrodipicolinate synthase